MSTPRPYHRAQSHWKRGALVGTIVGGLVIAGWQLLPQAQRPPVAQDQQVPSAPVPVERVEQERQARTDWQAAAARLAAAERGQDPGLGQRLNETTALLAVLRSELQAHETQIAVIQKQIASDAPPGEGEGGGVGISPAEAAEAIRLLQTQYEDLAAKLTDDHPKLAAVRQQIADLKSAVAEPSHSAAGATPQRQALEQSLLAEQKQAAALREKERQLVKQQHELRAAAASPSSSAGAEQLKESVKLAEAKHREAAQHLEQARQAATAIRLPAGTNSPASVVTGSPSLTLPVGVVAGLLGVASAAATMLLAARLNRIVTTRRQLAALWDLPVVGTIPAGASRAS
ncbi:MAG TPA: hypothetical protein VFB80_17655 [Pirellulaceae bacterium]|nr:hypothetical protein [Pirellulaceae bacterium]